MDTIELRNKISLFFSFFKRKNVIISTLSTAFILITLVLGVYFVRFRQNTGTVHAESVQVKFISTATTVKNGDEFVVDVYIDTKGMSVTGSDLRVRYDPLLLKVESVTPGKFLPVVLLPQQLSSGSAQIVLGSNVTEPKNGTGILESVKFKVLGKGATANIYFGSGSAVAAIGQTANVLATPASLNINIEAGPTAAPTPTLSPSASPTATPVSTPTASPTANPSATPVSTPTGGAKPGDVSGDGVVNIVDIGLIIDNYGKSPIPNPKTDLNGDGTINIVDIGIVIDNLN